MGFCSIIFLEDFVFHANFLLLLRENERMRGSAKKCGRLFFNKKSQITVGGEGEGWNKLK